MQPLMGVLLFYDAPTPPPGTFDAFLVIPYLTKDVSTRSFLSLVQASPDRLAGTRYALHPCFSFVIHCLPAVYSIRFRFSHLPLHSWMPL